MDIQGIMARIGELKKKLIPQMSTTSYSESWADEKPTQPKLAPTPPATPTPMPGVRVDPEVGKFIDNTILPIGRKYKAPDAVMTGMFGAEGRLSGLGANRNNFYNIAAYDSDPNSANYYDTPEKGVEAFARFITGQADNYDTPEHKKMYQDAFAQFQKDGDPAAYMLAVQNANYAGDPATYAQRATNDYGSYSDFVINTPEYRRHNYKKAKK